MTHATADRPTATPSTTTTARSTLRRAGGWIAAAALVLVAAVVGLVATGSGAGAERLSPEVAAPQGAMAVAEVLRSQGVDVVVVHTTDDALAALGRRFGTTVDPSDDATLVLHDPNGILDADRLARLDDAAGTTVLLEPAYVELQALAPGVAPAGMTEGAADAGCADPTADRAGRVVGDDATYRVIDDAVDATTCFGVAHDDRARLVVLDDGERRVIVLGATTALTNEGATTAGNGALALGLLGEHPRLVWLVPSLDELADETPPTLGELSPPWVVPFAILAILVAVATAVVQGRRFGPLVIEPLPVIVPASETMRGRARLYERAGARLRAADALRIGTIGRIASTLGLPGSATVDEVIAAASAITGRPPGALRSLLVDRMPEHDRELVAIADELRALERDVAERAAP